MEQCIFMSRSQQEASKQPQIRAGRCSSLAAAGDAAAHQCGLGRGWPTEAIGDYVMKKERLAVDCPLVVVLRPGLWSEANYQSRAKLAVSPPRLCRAMAKIHKQASSRLNCVLLSRCVIGLAGQWLYINQRSWALTSIAHSANYDEKVHKPQSNQAILCSDYWNLMTLNTSIIEL